jgi:hypothetical protein
MPTIRLCDIQTCKTLMAKARRRREINRIGKCSQRDGERKHHHLLDSDRVVVEYSRDIFWWEPICRIGNKETSFAHAAISNDDTSKITGTMSAYFFAKTTISLLAIHT